MRCKYLSNTETLFKVKISSKDLHILTFDPCIEKLNLFILRGFTPTSPRPYEVGIFKCVEQMIKIANSFYKKISKINRLHEIKPLSVLLLALAYDLHYLTKVNLLCEICGYEIS